MGLIDRFFGNRNKGSAVAKYSLIDYNQYFDSTSIDGTSLELFELGELNLTTGKIIACDPLVCLYDSLPFTSRENILLRCVSQKLKTREKGMQW